MVAWFWIYHLGTWVIHVTAKRWDFFTNADFYDYVHLTKGNKKFYYSFNRRDSILDDCVELKRIWRNSWSVPKRDVIDVERHGVAVVRRRPKTDDSITAIFQPLSTRVDYPQTFQISQVPYNIHFFNNVVLSCIFC